ncbi:MAG: intermembrane transport protein PqiB [Aquabacterium sp.]
MTPPPVDPRPEGPPPAVTADAAVTAIPATDPLPPAPQIEREAEVPLLGRQNRLRLSTVWIVPLVAAVIGLVLVVRAVLETGPTVTIEFRSAEGIEPGRTELRFKEVVVGRVKAVRLGADRNRVLVTATLDKSAQGLAVADTRFWVVRPRIGTAGVSGLGTLLSGAYIGIDAGESADAKRQFDGLDQPPLVLRGEPGRSFVLRADDLGSLDVGSPVYHRRVRVGRVVGWQLDPDSRALDLQIFIEAPHERLVTADTRFWNASGVDVVLNASGLTVNAQSIASVVAGGVAFAEPPLAPASAAAGVAAAGRRFRLHGTERAAMAPEDGEPMRVRMVFQQSLRGLEPGAPVDLLGVEIGTVMQFTLKSDGAGTLPVEVLAHIWPQRMGALRERFAASAGAGGPQADRRLIKQLVDRGLRAQVRHGNLLTGRLFIALEFAPKAAPVAYDALAPVPTLPTIPGTFADAQDQVAEMIGKLSKVRFDEMGGDAQVLLKSLAATSDALKVTLDGADQMLRTLTPQAQQALSGVGPTLAELRRTLTDAQGTLAAAQKTLSSAERNLIDPQGPLPQGAAQTLAELQRTAQALRVLADYLQRHPESLLRGKPPDPEAARPREDRR